MHKLLLLSAFCIGGLASIFFAHTTLAVDFSYGFSVEKPVEHFMVKPDFKGITTEFMVTNTRDPVYMQLKVEDSQNFLVTVYEIDSGQTRAISAENSTFLLLPDTSKLFKVEIANINPPQTELRDRVVDISARFKIIQLPKNVKKSVVLEPVIHKYIILSITKDGNMNLDPKIALFQNVNGAVSILNGPQNLIATIQNRGDYMLSTSGIITVSGPYGYEEKFIISPTHIFAGGQKNLSVQGQNNQPLISLPSSKLSTGRYTASIDLTIPGTNTPHLFGNAVFWLISPTYIIASVLVCIIIILTVFILGVKHL